MTFSSGEEVWYISYDGTEISGIVISKEQYDERFKGGNQEHWGSERVWAYWNCQTYKGIGYMPTSKVFSKEVIYDSTQMGDKDDDI